MPGIPDVEAAEFAEYLQDERERARDSRSRAGGMYHRAMMRAYAESVGADPELAVIRRQVTVELPPTEPLPSAPAAPSPRLQRHAAPPRPFIGLAALALLVVASGVIWSVVDSDVQPTADLPETAMVSAQPAAPSPPATTLRPQPTAAASQRRRPAEVMSAVPAAAVRTAAPPRPSAIEGTLSITSQPAGARVTVNGIGWGETPVTIRHLEFGSKRIRLTMQGYVSEERLAHLSPGDPVASTRIVLRRRLAPAAPRPPIAGAR